MNRAIDTIKDFINEHDNLNLCMDWQDVLDCEDISDSEKGIKLAYEVGRYTAFIEILHELERMNGQLCPVVKED